MLWMDASFRWIKNDLHPVYQLASSNGGIVLFIYSLNVVTGTADPALYSYIPTYLPHLATVRLAGTGAIFIRNTEDIFKNILHWWILCALDAQCIAPPNAKHACAPRDTKNLGKHMGCHRYDQSTLNVLLANYYQFNRSRYVINKNYVKVNRFPTTENKLKLC